MSNYFNDRRIAEDWYSWRVALEDAGEIVHTRTGEIYPFTEGDIKNMIEKLKITLADVIYPGCTVSMFLSLEEGFIPILLYHYLIEGGATVFRYGVRNLERQIQLFDVSKTDVIIAAPSLWRYIKSIHPEVENLTWIAYISLNRSSVISNDILPQADRIVIEHDMVPAFFIQRGDGLFSCPGYLCTGLETPSKDMDNRITQELLISTDDIEGFYFDRFKTGMAAEMIKDSLSNDSLLIKGILQADQDTIYGSIKKLLQRHQISYENDSLELDSLGMVELLVLLEEEFSFTVEVDEIKRSDFETIDSLISFINKKLGARIEQGGTE